MNAPPKTQPPGGEPGGARDRQVRGGRKGTYSYPSANASEDQIHIAIFDYLAAVLLPGHRCFHVPNGGRRDAATAQKLKKFGTVPGIPDLCLISRGAKIAFIEVKAEKGRLSPAQQEFRTWCVAHAIPHCVARSVNDARVFLASLKIPTREVRP